MNPQELNNSDLDRSKNHISNVSNNTLNLNENRLSSLSISYISYFYHVFPLHLNSFNRLFSDVISPKLSILITSVNTFTGLTTQITEFNSILKRVSGYLDINPAASLLTIIENFKGQPYVDQVKNHINDMVNKLDVKNEYQKIIANVNSTQYGIVESFNNYLKTLYENLKTKMDKHQKSLEGNIKEYIQKIKENLNQQSSCAQKLIELICKDLKNLKTNQSNLGQFKNYENKQDQLIKHSTPFTPDEGEHFKTIFDTHKQYQQCLQSCFSEISTELNELKDTLKPIKNSTDNLINILKFYESDISNTQNIDDVLGELSNFKKHFDNFGGYVERVKKLQKIGEYITTMKTTLEHEDKTKKKLKDKLEDGAKTYIDGLKVIEIKESEVKQKIDKIKNTNDLVVDKLKIAKISIEFSNSLNGELGNLQGITFRNSDFNEFRKNSNLINQKLISFKSTINHAVQKSEEEIKDLMKPCPDLENLIVDVEGELIPDELKELLKEDYAKDIPKITKFIDEALEVIKKIESELNLVQQSFNKLECAIEGVARNMIRCSLKSLSNHQTNSCITRSGVINEHDPLMINYSILNVTKYYAVINRFYEFSIKIDQIFQFIRLTRECRCIKSLERTSENIIFLENIYFQNIMDNLSKSEEEFKKSLKLDRIKKINELERSGNHFCLCIINKFVLYPAIINLFYLIFVDLEMLTTKSRKYDKYMNLDGFSPDISSFFIIAMEVLNKIYKYIMSKLKNSFNGFSGVVKKICFCTYSNDVFYPYLISIILFVSSLIENIWRADNRSIGAAIQSLSSLLSEFDMTSYNINSSNNLNIVSKGACKITMTERNGSQNSSETMECTQTIGCNNKLISNEVYFNFFNFLTCKIKGEDLLKNEYEIICTLSFELNINRTSTEKKMQIDIFFTNYFIAKLYKICSNTTCTSHDSCKCRRIKMSILELLRCFTYSKIISKINLTTALLSIMSEIKGKNHGEFIKIIELIVKTNFNKIYLVKSNVNTYSDHKNIANRFPRPTMG